MFLRETYAPKILGDKAKRLRKETGNDKLHTEYDRPDRTYSHVLMRGLSRPLMFLATEPIVQIISAYQAALYGAHLSVASYNLWLLSSSFRIDVSHTDNICRIVDVEISHECRHWLAKLHSPGTWLLFWGNGEQ